eukprot:1184342-Prorocentrum_minimum.AAC.2
MSRVVGRWAGLVNRVRTDRSDTTRSDPPSAKHLASAPPRPFALGISSAHDLRLATNWPRLSTRDPWRHTGSLALGPFGFSVAAPAFADVAACDPPHSLSILPRCAGLAGFFAEQGSWFEWRRAFSN